MFEEIVAIKIVDPKKNTMERIFIENAEEYNRIFDSLYIRECIVKTEKAFVFRDVPVGWKLYDCPKVYLTKEEKENFEKMLVEETDEQIIEGSYKGSFRPQLLKKSFLKYFQFLLRMFKYKIKKETFYYGENTVHIESGESNIFEAQFEDPYTKKITRRKNR